MACIQPPEHDVHIHHVECLRDGGILDKDDQLFDVFDDKKDQILAIHDESDSLPTYASHFVVDGTTPSSTSSSATGKSSTPIESPSFESKLNVISSSSDGDVVEITNTTLPSTGDLRVISDNVHTLQQNPTSSFGIADSASVSASASCSNQPFTHFEQKRGGFLNSTRIQHSALKTANSPPKTKYRVTISPDAQRHAQQEAMLPSQTESLLTRASIRKSRLTDNFFEAKERLQDKFTNTSDSRTTKTEIKASKLIPPMEAINPAQTVIALSDTTINIHLGIEISPVYDTVNSTRLQAVEIRQIDEDGRIGIDGRLRTGDRIVEINQRPVYQMSLSRARAYLHEMQTISHPSLTIDRSIETFVSDAVSHHSQSSTGSLQKRPLLSALQQANTTTLGTTFPVEITKRNNGFGFTITSRETAKGERLFYIGTVKAGGAAINKLRAGDRLLQVLHGGAAYKDGRLQVNDQLIGIEDIDLKRMSKNSDASDAITRCLKNIGPNASSVRLRVARKIVLHHHTVSSSVGNCTDESLDPIYDKSDKNDNFKTKSAEASLLNEQQLRQNKFRQQLRNSNEDSDSFTSDRHRSVSEDEISRVDVDAFSRKSPARRSISEKRHMGVASDLTSSTFLQNIKRNRQTSAPVLQRFAPFVSPPQQSRMTSSTRSATSLRERCRCRSSALFRSSTGTGVIKLSSTNYHDGNLPLPLENFTSSTNYNESITDACTSLSPNRRSQSLESVEAQKSSIPESFSSHPNESALRDAVRTEQVARRGHPNALKRAQKSRSNGCSQPCTSGTEDQNEINRNLNEPCAPLPQELSSTNKEKQQRRKSIGSSIFSKITQKLGGSRSRDVSPEKAALSGTAQYDFTDDKINRLKSHREWSKENNQLARGAPPPYKPKSASNEFGANDIYGTYKTENGKKLPACGYIRVANSKFYSKFIERNKEQSKGERAKMQCTLEKDMTVSNERTHIPHINQQSILKYESRQQQSHRQLQYYYYGGQDQQQQQREQYYARSGSDYYDAFNAWFAHSAENGNVPYNREDSVHAQVNSLQEQCEQDKSSKGLALIMQPATHPVPVIFPTSRTFMLAPSARLSGRYANSSRSSLRSLAKSVAIQPCRKFPSSEIDIIQSEQTSTKSKVSYDNKKKLSAKIDEFPNQLKSSDLPLSYEKPSSIISTPNSSSNFDSSSYKHSQSCPYSQQATKACTDMNATVASKSVKYIKIHHKPQLCLKQQPLRARSVNHNMTTVSSKQQMHEDLHDIQDYSKYLRTKRQDHFNLAKQQLQRVTVIATVPEEIMFSRRNATRSPSDRPKTFYSKL
ncbi:unnamed protein product [Thelazia callipaeda]|uniref:PDZ domain-containing protein n=1 Tax=Thelazia callipaeda TaxID=103827 RepID=A0A158RCT0_THECL|nr:unnamed protein product [Thelazia callipaeda]